MNLTSLFVPYIIGIPSTKAQVLGIINDDQYLLRHEYDTFNERGDWVHVIKEFQRDKWFIDTYYQDRVRNWARLSGLSMQGIK